LNRNVDFFSRSGSAVFCRMPFGEAEPAQELHHDVGGFLLFARTRTP
jgi:hypothetical protein